MLGSHVLDVALGLITVYLTLALAVTAANELLSQWRRLRTRHLELALLHMLDGQTPEASQWFLQLPLVRSLCDPDGHLPAYLDKQSFSAALLLAIDEEFASRPAPALREGIRHLPVAPDRRQLLLNLLQLSQGDVSAFRTQIEQWYEQTMERASGRYKRQIARWSLLIASLLAVAANADTLAIARALSAQPHSLPAAVQEQALSAAQASLQTALAAQGKPEQVLAAASETLGHLLSASPALPLGWQAVPLPSGWAWLDKCLGLLLTILATSIGAPFWFDLLSRVATIRSAGRRPA